MSEQLDALAALSAFVPDVLFERLHERVDLPWSEVVEGTLLLSDIAGFTALVESASERGPGRIEEFNAGMRRYMDLHVSEIRRRGGDILDMAGDSFLCLWRTDGSSSQRSDAARSAVAAGLEIQSRLDGFEVVPGAALAVRLGVASGSIDLTIVGRPGSRCELLVAGHAVDAVAAAEREGPSGAVAVDRVTSGLLGDDVRTSPLGSGLSRVDSLSGPLEGPVTRAVDVDERGPDQAVLLAQAPRLAKSVGVEVGSWHPESRRLSIVLALVPELRNETPAAVQDVVNRFHEIIDRHDGDGWTTFDGKGSIFVATFGAPFAAHENDGERAVSAAMELADRINTVTPASVGVATGRSLHGVSGNPQRRAVTMAGEVVNVAARLAASAGDRVLCDHESATAASRRFAFAVMNPILVKGKHERVPVFRPTELVHSAAPSASTVRGRSDEYAQLARLVDGPSTADDRPACVLIGESGMGKSTLVAEFRQQLADDSVVWVARGDSIGSSAPYAPWAAVVRDALGAKPDEPIAEVIERSRSVLEPEAAALAPLLADVLGGAFDDEATVALSRDKRVAATAQLVSSLCSNRDDAILIIEDAHWFDPTSLVVLDVLLRDPQRPTLVLTTRHRLPQLDLLFDDASTVILELGPLDRGSMTEMIADRLGVDDVPGRLSEFVFERSAGHPLFCDEMVKNLSEDGLIRTAGGSVTVGDLDAAQVPSTIEGVVVSRFDRLLPDEQRCLKAAAVVGAAVEPEVVAAAVGADQQVHLDRLVASGMLRSEHGSFEFSHVVSREVISALMAGEQRAQLHRAVASYLESADHPSARRIGYHWLEAGDADRAVTFLKQAADASLRTGSFQDALDLYRQVGDLLVASEPAPGSAQDRESAMVGINRAVASFYLGDMQGAAEDLAASVRVLDRPQPPAEPVPGRVGRGTALLRRLGGRRSHVEPRDVVPNRDAEERALLDAYQRLSQLNYLRGVPADEMRPTIVRSLELAERVGDSSVEAWASSQLSAVSGMLGRVDDLRIYRARAVELVESGRADDVASDVWRTIAVAHAGLGEWSTALHALNESAAAQSQTGREAGIWQTRAAIHLCAGDFVNADTAWRRAFEAGEAIGNRVQMSWSRLDEIQTLIGRGTIDRAVEALAALDAEFGELTDPLGRIEYHYTLALVRNAQGDATAAHEAASVVMQMVEASPPSGFHWVEFCSGVVEVYVSSLLADHLDGRRQSSELAEKAEFATSVLERLGTRFRHVVPRVAMSRGLIATTGGDDEAGRRHLERARAEAQRSGFSFDAARSTVLIELMSPSPDNSELDRARTVFESLGADRWADRATNVRNGRPFDSRSG